MSTLRLLRAVPVFAAGAAVAAALAVAPASAAIASAPASTRAAATAAAPINNSVLTSVSCPAARYCLNVGWADRNSYESATSHALDRR